MSSGGPPSACSAARLTRRVAVVAAVVTIGVTALPFLDFAYRSPALHVALETGNALVALLVGFLVYGRFREHRRLQELLLVLALVTVAVANLGLSAVPGALTSGGDEEHSRWAALAIRFLGTVLLATAAVLPRTALVGRRRTTVGVLAAAGTVVAVGILALWHGSALPPTVDPGVALDDASRPLLAAHPAVLTVHGLGVVLYAIAAAAFTRQAGRTGDELLRWFGAACVLAAVARVHYLLFPSLYSEYVYTGDLFRLGFYVLVLVGASREIRSYWELRARTAVLEDRRRMARDLHDGLTQELAYIAARSRWLAAHPGDTRTAERIGAASGRALDEARRAIAALTRPLDETFTRTLQQLADDMAARHDIEVVTDLDPAIGLPPAEREDLLRIVGEAVTNAVRHGRARQVRVHLRAEPLCLTVADDGRGFDLATPRTRPDGGFGLISMRERARALGAEWRIESAPGRGATVQVTRR
ncbi:sensor histidine kinase [Geodermatophilus sp. SYSU D00758]